MVDYYEIKDYLNGINWMHRTVPDTQKTCQMYLQTSYIHVYLYIRGLTLVDYLKLYSISFMEICGLHSFK